MAQFAENQSLTVGPFKITLLADGGGKVVPTATYPSSTAEGWQRYPELLADDGDLMVTIGGFLIETGDRKIVCDTGFGPMTVDFPGFGPFMGGKFLDSFQATGLKRDEVTDVLYSHLHLDHVGWTTMEVDGKRELTFPRARHVVTQPEWDFWYGGDNPIGPDPERVQKPLLPIIRFITPGEEIAPGITVLATPGHTPGHISLRLDAGKERVMMIFDLLHCTAQFNDVDWFVAFDVDPTMAQASREKMIQTLLEPDTITADAHFADYVFGRLSQNADGRLVWTPIG